MVPKLVQYFYDVENAYTQKEDISSYGFNEYEISVEEIMVSFNFINTFRNNLI